jgi:hypothetical protein
VRPKDIGEASETEKSVDVTDADLIRWAIERNRDEAKRLLGCAAELEKKNEELYRRVGDVVAAQACAERATEITRTRG